MSTYVLTIGENETVTLPMPAREALELVLDLNDGIVWACHKDGQLVGLNDLVVASAVYEEYDLIDYRGEDEPITLYTSGRDCRDEVKTRVVTPDEAIAFCDVMAQRFSDLADQIHADAFTTYCDVCGHYYDNDDPCELH